MKLPESQRPDAYTIRRLKRILEVAPPRELGPILLDIGCGRGLLSRLTNADLTYVGLNPSPNELKSTRWLGRKDDLRTAFSLPMIPVKTSSVDAVICTEVIEHVSQRVGLAAMKDMFTVLKPMGRLTMSAPNGGSLSHIARKRLLKKARSDQNPEHITTYDWSKLRSIALSAGFRDVKREPFDIIMEPKTIQAALAGTLPRKLRMKLADWFQPLDQLLIMTARKSV
jgi:SAM-dependent methyltransferase